MILPDMESPNTELSNWKIFLFWKYCQLRVTTYMFGSLQASWCQLIVLQATSQFTSPLTACRVHRLPGCIMITFLLASLIYEGSHYK